VTPSPSSPAEFASYLQAEIARWGKLIRDKGIKGEQ
jgi:tripartite-type tricarboxylate transporter receptor subunit TctC